MAARRLAAWTPPLLLAAACGLPVSTMHGPVPLAAGAASVSAGVAPVFLEEGAGEELALALLLASFGSVRYGLGDRLEVGTSTGGLNGVSADVKYNLISRPVHVSADLAASAGLLPDILGEGEEENLIGIHPALLVGTERVYGGAKLLIFPSERPWTVLFAGASIGSETRLVPEIAWLRDSTGESIYIAGLTVQRRWKPDFLQ